MTVTSTKERIMKNKNAKRFTGQAVDGAIILNSGTNKSGDLITMLVDLDDVFGFPYVVRTGDPHTTIMARKKKQAQKHFDKMLNI
jgi:hypothetical protein